jgi:hypothetical protein
VVLSDCASEATGAGHDRMPSIASEHPDHDLRRQHPRASSARHHEQPDRPISANPRAGGTRSGVSLRTRAAFWELKSHRGDRFKLPRIRAVPGACNGFATAQPHTNRAARRSRRGVCHSERVSVAADSRRSEREPRASPAHTRSTAEAAVLGAAHLSGASTLRLQPLTRASRGPRHSPCRARAASWRLTFVELRIPADTGKFTDAGMSDHSHDGELGYSHRLIDDSIKRSREGIRAAELPTRGSYR